MASIYKSSGRRRFVYVIIAITVFFAAWCVWVLWWPPVRHRNWLPAIAACWALLPPIWFFIEYVFVFDNWEDKDKVERFKDMQAHAAKIWAGMLALLTASYLED